MKTLAAVKTWEKTKVQFLVRHKSGRYYARLFQNGKETWKTLKTDHQSIAQARLAELLKEHRGRKGKQIDPANAKMTFADAAELDQQKLDEELALKRRTRKYYREVLAALLESWPGLAETELRRITPMALKAWAIRYGKMFSASRYNGTLSLLRRILQTAVESGVIYSNPAAGLERKAQKTRHLELPTREQFAEFIDAMQNAQTRDAHNCADLALSTAKDAFRWRVERGQVASRSESFLIQWRAFPSYRQQSQTPIKTGRTTTPPCSNSRPTEGKNCRRITGP